MLAEHSHGWIHTTNRERAPIFSLLANRCWNAFISAYFWSVKPSFLLVSSFLYFLLG